MKMLLTKMFAIGVLALLLLIPAGMIKNLIEERAERKNEAVTEVQSKWGSSQTVTGPVLVIPYVVTKDSITSTKDGEVKSKEVVRVSNVTFLPDKLNFDGNVSTELLKRGIYQITVYNSKLKVDGEFAFPDFSASNIPDKDATINWNDAYILFSLSDLKALQQNLELDWNGEKYSFKPGYDKFKNIGETLTGHGLNVHVPIKPENNYKFSFEIDLNGSDSINFIPLGKETNIHLTSNWASPSFDGSFLPDERNVTNEGFDAKWKILELNRDFPQVWDGNVIRNIQSSSCGARLIVTVDEYQKNMRSVKYAIMFIALTFMVFFFVEVLNKIKIHPIQYTLVGLSLVLFFSLLISITEHLNFNLAYLISAVGAILMVTLYSKTIFKNMRLTLIQGGILTAIYIFIYTIIQLEEYSLLFGSIGLFVVLAAIMFISRNIDWYSVGAKSLKDGE